MPTKAELLIENETLRVEHEKFRKQVVKKALSEAKRHGWCLQVLTSLKRMGLQADIPDLFFVEWQSSGATRWSRYDECHTTAVTAKRGNDWTAHDTDRRRIVKVDGYGNLIKVVAEKDGDGVRW